MGRWACHGLTIALVLASPAATTASEENPERTAVPFELFEDTSGEASFDDVRSVENRAAFRSVAKERPNLGASDSAWWLAFDLPPRSSRPAGPLWLQVPWALIDEATLYEPAEGESFLRHEAGRFTPVDERDVLHRYPVFRLDEDTSRDGRYYLRIRGNGTLIVPLELLSREAFETERRREGTIQGAFFGVLAMMTVFGAVAFALLREPMFFWYAVMVGGFAIWQASTYGLFATHVWPAQTFLIQRALHLSGLLFGVGAMIFTRTYLDTARRLPKLDRLMIPAGLYAVGGLVLWTLVFPSPVIVYAVVAVTTYAATWALVVSLVSFRQGYRPANYYLLAWVVGCVGAIGQAARAVGWAPSNLFTDYGLQTSVVLTFVALSLGIIDRMLGMRSTLAQNVEDIRRLEREDAATRTFLATASHDLRQPLHAVGLLLGALRARLSEPASVDLVEKIQMATTEMADMFGALLDISRLDAGMVKPQAATVPLAPLLERLADEYGVQAQRKGLEISAHAEPASVRSDPTLLARILRNLLTNALRYTDHGRITLESRVTNDGVVVTVADTGRGIPLDAQKSAFEPFRRVGSETDTGEALGLGLSIVHRLTHLLGHDLHLESAPGQGSTFTLRLPRADEVVPTPTSPPSTPVPTFDGPILVIDDDPAVRAGMRAQLEAWGYDVETAGEPDEAVAAAKAHRPALLFADQQLSPDRTGVDVIDEIRATLDVRVPALIISGDTSPETATAVRQRGLQLLTKPVQPTRLRLALSYAARTPT